MNDTGLKFNKNKSNYNGFNKKPLQSNGFNKNPLHQTDNQNTNIYNNNNNLYNTQNNKLDVFSSFGNKDRSSKNSLKKEFEEFNEQFRPRTNHTNNLLHNENLMNNTNSTFKSNMSFYNKKLTKPINIAPIPKEHLQNNNTKSNIKRNTKTNPFKIAESKVQRKFKIVNNLKKVSEYPEDVNNDDSQLDKSEQKIATKRISNFDQAFLTDNSSQVVKLDKKKTLEEGNPKVNTDKGLSEFDNMFGGINNTQLIKVDDTSKINQSRGLSKFDNLFGGVSNAQVIKIDDTSKINPGGGLSKFDNMFGGANTTQLIKVD